MRDLLTERELLGLGLDIPGMLSRGTLEREDELPAHWNRVRDTLSVRPDEEAGLSATDGTSNVGSEFLDESVVSSMTDRYGFLSGPDNQVHSTKEAPDEEVEVRLVKTQIRREAKWLEMMNDWESHMLKDYKKVRERCRKGIPSSVRSAAWLKLSGAHFYLNQADKKHQFKRLYNQKTNSQNGQNWIDDIEKDLHRNFPTHELFGGTYEKIGQAGLFQVLKAYCVLHPAEGYCQAMAPIAALLLMNMPAEQAFWCMVMICDKYIPGYYSPGLEAIQLDGDILHGLLRRVSPAIYKHLKKQEIEPVLYMTEWFLCVYSRTLPWPTVMRVWDMFLCEGVKVLFRVGLVLIRAALPKSVRKNCPSMYETLDALKNLPPSITQEEVLVEEILRLNLKEDIMEREHRKQVKRRKAAKLAAATAKSNGS
ncbi:TBC1 domain family member whacked-like [Tigriopus californicus]|nr:TBC1 domain family member whacked-like [Tigriopus californicus]